MTINIKNLLNKRAFKGKCNARSCINTNGLRQKLTKLDALL